jgi:hypothetical protein
MPDRDLLVLVGMMRFLCCFFNHEKQNGVNGLIALKEIGRIFSVPRNGLLFGLFMDDAAALFKLALQLLGLVGNHAQVVTGQLAPLLLEHAFKLPPVAVDSVFVHGDVLKNVDETSAV